jgi:hypothetical protein
MIRIDPTKGATGLINPAKSTPLYRCFDPWGWSKYVDLTVSKAQVDGDVTDFPLCIQGNEVPASFWTTVQADGGDLVVTGARSGRKFHRELGYISVVEGSEQLELHARVPFIGTGRDEVLRIYYGNAAADEPNESMTWNSSYAAVYHMNNKPGDATKILDSTSNGNHGTKGAGAAAPTEVAGLVGKAQQFVAANGQYIKLPDIAQLLGATQATWTALARNDARIYDQCIASDFGNVDGTKRWFFGRENLPNMWYTAVGDGTNIASAFINDVYAVSAWHFVWARFTGGVSLQTACDAASATNDTSVPAALSAGVLNNTYIGRNRSTVYSSQTLDELRLSSVAWGPEWIALEHKTLLDPTTLYGISAEGTV